MRYTLILLTAIKLLVTYSCNDTSISGQKAKSNSTFDSTKETSEERVDIDSNCDSLKFPDFKSDLQKIEVKISPELESEIYQMAKQFIQEQCKEDTLYCGDIYLKHRNHFLSAQGQELFSFGYTYKNVSTSMEEQSASFFVFGIKKDGNTIFHDIASDLVGEIQLSLKGLEELKTKTIVWGQMYPYFDNHY